MTASLSDWYRGRRVYVTGHTGFKGSWLIAWLREAGAVVTGFALHPEADRPALFRDAALDVGIDSQFGDILDSERLRASLVSAAPEIVFHLAAQSLVRRSYREPVQTMAVNVIGTANLLEAVRLAPSTRAVIVVTSDKCYENDGSGRPLAEDAAMGGHDPYSASKGCAELVTMAWRRSFLAPRGVAVATARAGNVFGGGDWGEDRLIPDLVTSASRGEVTVLRNPDAIRPWQYVLEPLHGYLLLGRGLIERGEEFAEGWNFGPAGADALTVRDIARRFGDVRGRSLVSEAAESGVMHEAPTLRLDASKAVARLGWKPALTLDQALASTATWYRDAFDEPAAIPELVRRHLADFTDRLSIPLPAVAGIRSNQ